MAYDPMTGEEIEESVETPVYHDNVYDQYSNNDINRDGYQDNSTQRRRPPHKGPRRPKKRTVGEIIAITVVCALIASVIFCGVNFIYVKFIKPGSSSTVSQTAVNTSVESTEADNVAEVVAENCMPSIVSITCKSVQEVQNYYFGGTTQSQEVTSAGSGIIVGQNDTELLIATNNHVIDGATELTVTFVNNDSQSAQIKGTDSDMDLAVIAVQLTSIDDETKNSIKVATMGDSTQVKVGQTAIAIGNALGYGQSVTKGIISAVDRTITSSSSDGSTTTSTATYLQTDAPINPGNSGGALLNSKGELIGINTAKTSSVDVDAMGYAIPISDAKPIIDNLMSQKTRSVVDEANQGKLGVKVADVTSQAAKIYSIPTGVYIAEVTSGGAAANAGLQKGDVITKFDGTTISSSTALQSKLKYYSSGETVKITYYRADNSGEYKEAEANVTLQ